MKEKVKIEGILEKKGYKIRPADVYKEVIEIRAELHAEREIRMRSTKRFLIFTYIVIFLQIVNVLIHYYF